MPLAWSMACTLALAVLMLLAMHGRCDDVVAESSAFRVVAVTDEAMWDTLEDAPMQTPTVGQCLRGETIAMGVVEVEQADTPCPLAIGTAEVDLPPTESVWTAGVQRLHAVAVAGELLRPPNTAIQAI